VFVGVDVGAARLHCVGLNQALRVTEASVYAVTELEQFAERAASASVVAVDAPATLSIAKHARDPALSPKFARARCAEIALGRDYGLWVPFVAPRAAEPVATWMQTGLAVYEVLRETSATVIEVFPYAGYRRLVAPTKLAKKASVDGARQRIAALGAAGVHESSLSMWSHDGLDALLGALVAYRRADGTAIEVTCGHDGSSIWLPQ
jgi:predicted nuclease with RNAse H fold